jgi:DNA repair protein RecN (Recombination protein N)
MLLELNIENFILIEKLNISFHDKLNVFTGETGAGKSMIIGSINAGLGGKVSGDMIRSGAEKAVVELIFKLPNSLKPELDDLGVDYEDELIITREIYPSNRSAIRLNGRITTLQNLKTVTDLLLDIHGQHAHQTLLYPKYHVKYLDQMGEESHKILVSKVEAAYHNVKKAQAELKKLEQTEQNLDRDYIQFQLDEIDALNLSPEDELHLEEKFNYFKNLEVIHQNVSGVQQIFSGDHDTNGIRDLIQTSIKFLSDIKDFNEVIHSIHDKLNEVNYQLDDVNQDLRYFADSMDVDEEEMYQVEERMNAVNTLKLKHGKTIADILFKREQLAANIELIDSHEQVLNEAKGQLSHAKKEYLKLGKELSEQRQKLKSIFEKRIKNELTVLNMDQALLEVNFKSSALNDGEYRLSQVGIDQVEFLIRTNPGMPLGPLSKIASGGELSRIMLAIKIALASKDGVPTLIFDEVDSGISGSTANVVGEKIKVLSQDYQILCITHLPQISVMGDHHYLISKGVEHEVTKTEVTLLKETTRLNEIARMLSGDETSKVSIQNAKEMLDRVESNFSVN